MPNPVQLHGVPCVFIEKKPKPDGMGGWTVEWVEGAEFKCVISKVGSVQQLVAGQRNEGVTFDILVDNDFPIKFHDVFKVKETGEYYRVTEDPNDMTAPEESTLGYKAGRAEKYSLD